MKHAKGMKKSKAKPATYHADEPNMIRDKRGMETKRQTKNDRLTPFRRGTMS